MSERKALTLRNVPEDVFEILINEQSRIKLERKTAQFGIDQVVYKLIRTLHKLIQMPRRQYNSEHMCVFARYVVRTWRNTDIPSTQAMEHLLSEWKRECPDEYQEEKTMAILIGKTPADVLGLKGPKPMDPPSGS